MQAWLEDHLKGAKLQVAQYNTFEALQRLSVLYSEIEKHPAWKDYMSRVTLMRNGIIRELLTGTLDNYGNNNDDSKRAVLTYIEKMLSFVPELHARHEELLKRKQEMDKRAEGKIHGFENVRGGASDSAFFGDI